MKRLSMIVAFGIMMLPLNAKAATRQENIAKGKQIAFENSMGNCLACHMIQDGEMPGNLGPPLLQMKQRYPKRGVLRAKIWDATRTNPQSIMPPFGKHGILTNEEVDLVVDYMYSL